MRVMRNQYVKPEMVEVEIVISSMLAASLRTLCEDVAVCGVTFGLMAWRRNERAEERLDIYTT